VGKRRILIAEDVLINRDILGAVLRGQGHHVVFAHDGAQAVELVQSETFDLVLMDVQMPVMDGVEATRRIRNLPGPQRALPILGLTANVMARERDSYLRAGMDACLKKPIDWHELADAVQRFTGDTPAAAQPREATQDGPSPPTHALVDLQVLADLEGAVGADAARTLLRDGMTTFHRYCEAMETGPGMELDVPHALASAHKIHGSAGTLGLRAIADAASRLEEALSRDPRDKAVIAQMRAAINGTVGELMQLGLLPASDNRAVP
jgi:CheY-like chemotaxis protein